MASPTSAITTYNGSWIARGVYQTQWTITASGAGLAESAMQLPDKVIMINGFVATGVGGTSRVSLQGSNATTPTGAYFALRHALPTVGPGDSSNVLDALATNGIFQILENPRWIRPLATTVTSAASISVIMISRGAF